MAAAATAPAQPAMQYRLLGNSGLKVSVLSFGSWVSFKSQVNQDSAYDLIKAAFAAGINFFDSAETYANGEAETILGEAIQRGVREGVWQREDWVLSTKIFFGTGRAGVNNRGLSRKHIVEGLRASLKRMQLDYVDIVLAHRPDPVTPIEETVRAFNFAIDQGLAFYWGTSEWSSQQLTEACLIADKLGMIRPIADQPQYNLLERHRVEVEYLPLYHNYGLGLTVWSPLASGVLTGKYSGAQVPEGSRLSLADYAWLKQIKLGEKRSHIDTADLLKPVAEKLGCSLAQLAIAWCVANKNVSTVILGATSLKQLHENIAALGVVPKLTPEVLEEIEQIAQNKPALHTVTQQVNRLRL